MWADGRKICQHIVAAFIHLSSKDPKSTSSDDNYGGHDLEIPPPLWCHHCGSTQCTKKEKRPLSKMQHTTSDDNSSVIYRCHSCDRTFTDRPGFVGKHYSEQVILSVLMSVARKMSPYDAACTANEHYDTNVSERSARRWVTEYANMISSYADGLKTGSQCNAVSVDEKRYKVGKEDWWVYTAICLKSRRIIATCYENDKLGYDASPFFHMIREKIRAPLLLLSDGLGGYKLGYKNVFKADPPTTLYIQDIGVNGVHVNNRHT